MKCAKKNCPEAPTHIVTWPTGRVTAACDAHAKEIEAIGCQSGGAIKTQRFDGAGAVLAN